MSEDAIRVEGISYAYGDVKAVDNVSFTVAPGEVLGFLGPNGAGKSTTIKLLTGQMRPQSGEISILGMNVAKERDKIQGRIGVCFEEKNLYLNLSAKENLHFFARLFGIRDFDAAPLLQRVGLADRADDRVKGYSKGMQQRLMVARCLLNTPDILFLDEPTDGLDPVSSQAIRRVIEEEAERGAAILLTTHDMDEADKLSDRVAFINDGKIAALDTPENLKLAHGQRSVRVRTRENDEVREQVVLLDASDTGDRLKDVVGAEGLLTIHTEEATLEAVFITLTGRGLQE